MSNPTTNFGWVMPTATDLVTDLPADFAVFGQGVDTSFAYLNGGTTGQVLSKTSNTNLAFTWVSANPGDITGVTAGTGISGGGTSGDVTVTNSMATAITTAGDLIKGTGSGTFDRLGIGSTGQVLTVASGAPSWAAASGGLTLISSTSISGSNSYSFNSVFTSTYTNYKIFVKLSAVTNANDDLFMKMRAAGTDSTTGLTSQRVAGDGTSASSSRNTSNASNWLLGLCGSGNPTIATYTLDLLDPQAATRTTFQALTLSENASVIQNTYMAGFAANNTQYDGFTLTTTGNISATVKIYGYGN